MEPSKRLASNLVAESKAFALVGFLGTALYNALLVAEDSIGPRRRVTVGFSSRPPEHAYG